MGRSVDAYLGWGYVLDCVYEEDALDCLDSDEITVDWHGYGGNPEPFVHIEVSHKWASWGSPEHIDQSHFEQGTVVSWTKILNDALSEAGIDIPKTKPGWFICSYSD